MTTCRSKILALAILALLAFAASPCRGEEEEHEMHEEEHEEEAAAGCPGHEDDDDEDGDHPDLIGPKGQEGECEDHMVEPSYWLPGKTVSDVFPDFHCFDRGECSNYNAHRVDWTHVYSSLRSIMQCEKRVAGLMIRTCFHESNGFGANDASGWCSTRPESSSTDHSPEHRRCENSGHVFFDHSMAVVHAVSAETNASHPDVLAVACFVAYEIVGGSAFDDSLPCDLKVGRCHVQEEVVDSEGHRARLANPLRLPAGDASVGEFLEFWRDTGFEMREAAALMATHTLIADKVFDMHFFNLDYVHMMALDWQQLGYTCDTREAEIDEVNDILWGTSNRFGFTTVEGANYNQALRYFFPEPEEDEGEAQCRCFDPEMGGVQGSRGGWAFTENDCNVLTQCIAYFHGTEKERAAVHPLAPEYCQAYKDFAKSTRFLLVSLGEATRKLVTQHGIFANPANPGSISLPSVKAASLANRNIRHDLCTHTTPCKASVFGECLDVEYLADVKDECGIPAEFDSPEVALSWVRSHYRCLIRKTLGHARPSPAYYGSSDPTCGNPIVGIMLVDCSTGKDLNLLEDGDVIEEGEYAIRAVVRDGFSGSIDLSADGRHARSERSAPYTLDGDRDGRYQCRTIRPGSAEFAAKPSGQGDDKRVSVNVRVASRSAKVTGLRLVDCEHNSPEGPLSWHLHVDEKSRVNVVADTVGDVRAVQFYLNNVHVRTESVAPYSLFGDRNGDYACWEDFEEGTYYVRAVAVDRSDRLGGELSFSFVVTEKDEDDDDHEAAGGHGTADHDDD